MKLRKITNNSTDTAEDTFLSIMTFVPSSTTIGKLYFIIDSYTGLLKVFTSPRDINPKVTYHLRGGQIETPKCM